MGQAEKVKIDKIQLQRVFDNILGNMGISRMNVDTELKEGTKVKIIAGPFNGMFGKIDSVDLTNQKVMLSVDLFGQETSVEVDMQEVETI